MHLSCNSEIESTIRLLNGCLPIFSHCSTLSQVPQSRMLTTQVSQVPSAIGGSSLYGSQYLGTMFRKRCPPSTSQSRRGYGAVAASVLLPPLDGPNASRLNPR